MPNIFMRFACLIVCSATCISLNAQQVATPHLPSDPSALMALAHDKNGLTGPGVQPWHIRGNYTFYDKGGKPEGSGIYEEWWFGPGRYKRVFNSPQFSQTDYGDGTHLFRDGAQNWPDGNESLLRSLLVNPVPDAETLKSFTLHGYSVSTNGTTLNCVALFYPLTEGQKVPSDFFPVYCFGPNIPLLRIDITGPEHKTSYDKFVIFQGHYIAREVHESYGGKPLLDFTADVIEDLKGSPASILTPPPTAKPVDLNSISFIGAKNSTFFSPLVLKKTVPFYPQMAREERISGTVVLHVTIAPNGHIDQLTAVDGPKMLWQTSMDAVKQWVYEPFVVLDKPVPIEIAVKVIFSLGP